MSTLPNSSSLVTPPLSVVDPIDSLIAMLKHIGLETQRHLQPTASGSATGIVVTFSAKHLELFGNSIDDNAGANDFMRNMLYPFQEMLRMVADNTITGFAFVPENSLIEQASAHKRTELIGRTLQALCNGEISLR